MQDRGSLGEQRDSILFEPSPRDSYYGNRAKKVSQEFVLQHSKKNSAAEIEQTNGIAEESQINIVKIRNDEWRQKSRERTVQK